ncbi:armadillo/beta-catenin repeat family protein [Striga asiatica]|uniref:Armadillo/beta-catenin repeat family protein n=1 Tax=Striga asiatica TaxID=4170 RepID=A0A5A7P7C4_STRAF|nr:armadillo/beta-catenin repeat family protein [Striga asiatica]
MATVGVRGLAGCDELHEGSPVRHIAAAFLQQPSIPHPLSGNQSFVAQPPSACICLTSPIRCLKPVAAGATSHIAADKNQVVAAATTRKKMVRSGYLRNVESLVEEEDELDAKKIMRRVSTSRLKRIWGGLWHS